MTVSASYQSTQREKDTNSKYGVSILLIVFHILKKMISTLSFYMYCIGWLSIN